MKGNNLNIKGKTKHIQT